MKKIKILLIFLLILSAAVYAQKPSEIFSRSELMTEIDISSTAEIMPLGTGARITSFQTDLLFFPKEDEYLKVYDFSTSPDSNIFGDKLRYDWKNPPFGEIKYSYKLKADSKKQLQKIYSRINFPIKAVPASERQYLMQTRIIDSQSAAIKKKAEELAGDKDDLYEVVTEIGTWVKDNIKYDLSTLTSQATQAAGWVLANRIGVCDEITSLFIAFLRSLGVPARFISGVSYTNSPDFPQNWGPHGWAEVYFPGVGWVPYDVTFGEFGWLDPGHIKMMESNDPQEPSTKFEWKGNDVDVKVHDLEIKAKAIKLGPKTASDIRIKVDVEKAAAGAGSYNLAKATIENLREYYVTTDLALAKVDELEDLDSSQQKKLIMLKPKETKTVAWMIKVIDDLKPEFVYKIPLMVYTIKNESASTSFTATKKGPRFSIEDMKRLEKGAESPKIDGLDISCSLSSDKVNAGETITMTCEVRCKEREVKGKYCFEECKEFELEAGEKRLFSHNYVFDKLGSKDLIFRVEEGDKIKRSVLNAAVVGIPKIKITDLKITPIESYGDDFKVSFKIEKDTFTTPKNLRLLVTIGKAEVNFEISSLDAKQEFVIDANTRSFLQKEELIKIKMIFEDEFGNFYTETKEYPITLKKVTFWDRIRMFFARIFG